MLILFAPGAPREDYFETLARVAEGARARRRREGRVLPPSRHLLALSRSCRSHHAPDLRPETSGRPSATPRSRFLASRSRSIAARPDHHPVVTHVRLLGQQELVRLGRDQSGPLLLRESEAHHRLVAGERQVDDPPDPELDPIADQGLLRTGKTRHATSRTSSIVTPFFAHRPQPMGRGRRETRMRPRPAASRSPFYSALRQQKPLRTGPLEEECQLSSLRM